MADFRTGSGFQETPKAGDLSQFGDVSSEKAVFDASQYAFFGKDLVDWMMMKMCPRPADFEEEEFLFGIQEGELARSMSDVDDLVIAFSNVNKVVSAPRNHHALNITEQEKFCLDY